MKNKIIKQIRLPNDSKENETTRLQEITSNQLNTMTSRWLAVNNQGEYVHDSNQLKINKGGGGERDTK